MACAVTRPKLVLPYAELPNAWYHGLLNTLITSSRTDTRRVPPSETSLLNAMSVVLRHGEYTPSK